MHRVQVRCVWLPAALLMVGLGAALLTWQLFRLRDAQQFEAAVLDHCTDASIAVNKEVVRCCLACSHSLTNIQYLNLLLM